MRGKGFLNCTKMLVCFAINALVAGKKKNVDFKICPVFPFLCLLTPCARPRLRLHSTAMSPLAFSEAKVVVIKMLCRF